MATRKTRPRKKSSALNGAPLPYTPPQSELDQNIRMVLIHIVKHYKTITVPVEPVDPDGMLNWNMGQTPAGKTEITVWWTPGEKEGGE
jgi:hypothetical protein